jgi:hypothetical protein
VKATTPIHRGASLRATGLTAGLALLVQAAIISVIVARSAPASQAVVTTVGSSTFPLTGVNVGVGAIVPLALGALLFLTSAASDRRLRWIEASLSASITVFLVAQLNGIRELGALVAIYALTSAAVLFGALHEDRREGAGRRPAIFGAMVGIVPWGLIAWYEILPTVAGDPGPAVWVRILTLAVLGLFIAGAVLAWRGASASWLRIVISVATRSVPAWTVAIAVAGGLQLT